MFTATLLFKNEDFKEAVFSLFVENVNMLICSDHRPTTQHKKTREKALKVYTFSQKTQMNSAKNLPTALCFLEVLCK